MKTLTISQPYASLIADGLKFVENRSWPTNYRGPLAIHAGLGTQYLSKSEMKEQNLPTGCVVAICRLIACVPVKSLAERIRTAMPIDGLSLGRMQEILEHQHTEGPYGFVLENVKKLIMPVPAIGKQGFFDIPDRNLGICVECGAELLLTPSKYVACSMGCGKLFYASNSNLKNLGQIVGSDAKSQKSLFGAMNQLQ